MTVNVVVLLATFNGRRWLPEQVDSILNQRGVDVRIVAIDDLSTDGTPEWLDELALRDSRVTRLPVETASGGAAANFYRLITLANIEPDELVAFSDQDDIWLPGKLERHAHLLTQNGSDGVSSNVTSFTADGRRTLVVKNEPQRRFDYLLQGPGPGSTFMISQRLLQAVRESLGEFPELATRIDYHDMFIYAVARASGLTWHIDSIPSVDYRQHAHNVIGSNVGVRSALARLRLIGTRWHRQQSIAMTELAITRAEPELRSELERIHALMRSSSASSRLKLARLASQFRRRPRDRAVITVLMVLGVW